MKFYVKKNALLLYQLAQVQGVCAKQKKNPSQDSIWLKHNSFIYAFFISELGHIH